MSTEKNLWRITEVVPVVFFNVWSIATELLLVGTDEFGLFGFATDMVHRPENAFHLVISFVEYFLLQPSVVKMISGLIPRKIF